MCGFGRRSGVRARYDEEYSDECELNLFDSLNPMILTFWNVRVGEVGSSPRVVARSTIKSIVAGSILRRIHARRDVDNVNYVDRLSMSVYRDIFQTRSMRKKSVRCLATLGREGL